MSSRHLSRSIVMQTLFECDFNHGSFGKALEILQRNIDEFAPGVEDVSFMKKLLDGVIKKQSDLDKIIGKAAPDWPLDKISIVDRNVLRIGLYELLFSSRKEVPAKVAINESIELAKTYGGETSGKFVNGVLGAVYKELGEPGKDEVSKRKKDVPFEQMPIEKLCGAVVYAKNGNDVYLALVHDVFGHWTLSKGHLKENEKEEDGLLREIREEIGVDIKVVEKLGQNEYVASDPEKGKIRKQVLYFLAESEYKDLGFKKTGGLDDAKWFKITDILDLNLYDDIIPIFTKAIGILLKGDKKSAKDSE
ncbi:transcription antitermination factor NusB [Candidatus Nomurabacteria bacterium]|nr:transcription antitermination factor NusB [Candidatus Nomurabacteria bacterium]